MDISQEEQEQGELLPRRKHLASELLDWVEAFVFALAIVVVIYTFFFKIVTVEGSSMVPTFVSGEKAVVSDLCYAPTAGDIAVVSQPSFDEKPLFKRIIATEGMTVDVDYATGAVYVDGKMLEEPYIAEPINHPGDVALPLTVPKGFVFVMGDNRNYSTDSRSSQVGLIDQRNVLGKVYLRIFPFQKFGLVD